MTIPKLLAALLLVMLVSPIPSRAEIIRYYEQDGVTYCETRRILDASAPETRLESQSQTIYRTEAVMGTQEMVRVYWTPVTQYAWEGYWVGRWNPFVEPRLAYRYVPRTHWEQRSELVKVPVSTYRTVPETRIVQVPAPSYRTIPREAVASTPVNSAPAAVAQPVPQVAQRPQLGGIRRQEGDPPRYGMGDGWQAAGTLR